MVVSTTKLKSELVAIYKELCHSFKETATT